MSSFKLSYLSEINKYDDLLSGTESLRVYIMQGS